MVIFRKIRLISWITEAFLKKHQKIIVGGFIIGILGFFSIPLLLPYLPQLKKTVRIAKIGQIEPDNLPLEIKNMLSLGLTTISIDGSAAPGLAKSWQVSDDGLTYTFYLEDNYNWLDDTPVKADQIKYHFSDVESEVVDDKTLKFKLKELFSPFPTILSKPAFKEEYLGVGPYKIKRMIKKGGLLEKIIFDSSDQTIIFHLYPTQESALLGFKLGEVDVIEDLLDDSLGPEWQGIATKESKEDKNKYLAIFFNTQDATLSDKNVRQALAYGLKDKPEGEKRATGPISPLSWAYNKEVKLYEYDPQKAKELIKKDDKEEIKVNLKISTTAPFLTQAEKIKKSWEETLGFTIDIELVNVLPQDYQVFLGLQEIPSDPDQYLLWHSTRPENITHFKNPKIDKLLEDGRKLSNIEDRKEKYDDFQRFLSEECPAVFLSYPTTYKLVRKRVFTLF